VVIHQVNQDIERLWSQRNLFIAALKQSTVRVQREMAERVLVAEPFSRMCLRAAHHPLLAATSPLGFMRTFMSFMSSSSHYHRGFNTSAALPAHADSNLRQSLNERSSI
jgi:hypothetical protein